METVTDETQLKRERQTLKSPDILAIKGLAQFERFPAAVALGTLIENWHLSDFHISRARPEQEAGEMLSLTLMHPNLIDELPLGDTHALADLRLPEAWAGRTLHELNLRAQ